MEHSGSPGGQAPTDELVFVGLLNHDCGLELFLDAVEAALSVRAQGGGAVPPDGSPLQAITFAGPDSPMHGSREVRARRVPSTCLNLHALALLGLVRVKGTNHNLGLEMKLSWVHVLGCDDGLGGEHVRGRFNRY